MMKKLLIGVGVVVLLLVAAAVMLPMLIPVDTYKQQIARQVEAATGREFAINGDLSLSVLPRIAIEANKVSLSNRPGAKNPNMMELSKLEMRLALLPLLSGEVVLDSFVLVEPVIHLEVDQKGRPNWQFGEAPPPAAPEAPAEPTAGGGPSLRQISLGDVRLVDGRVTYSDARAGTVQTAENIDMSVALPSLDQALRAEGALTWNGERVTLQTQIAEPRTLMQGGTSEVEAGIKSDPVTVSYKGTMANAQPLSIRGKVDLDTPSVRKLAAWAGTPIAGAGSGLGPLAIEGDVAIAGPKAAFTSATLQLDKMNGTGDLRLDFGGAKPSIIAALTVDAIDLDPYLPAPDRKADAPTSGEGEQSAGWSEEPIDLSALQTVNADVSFRTGGVEMRDLKLGETQAKAVLKGGKLVLDLAELALYGGTGKGRITLDSTGAAPGLTSALTLSGLQAEPFLKDAAGFDRIEGTANMSIDATTQGRSQKEMVSALDGKGRIQFLNGAIRGINLAAMVRNVSSALLDPEARETQKTDFAELAGTFTITNGIVHNKDLFLKSPLLRLEGAGTVDLPQRRVDYRLTPKLVASLEGQGGTEALKGVAVPVVVKGPWDNPSFAPDVSGAVEEIAKDPEKALEAVKGLTGQSDKSGDTPKSGEKIEDRIKGLFGD